MKHMHDYVPAHLVSALRQSWSRQTAAPPQHAVWSPRNPAMGHGLVTALLLEGELGGELQVGFAKHHALSDKTAHFRNAFLQPGAAAPDERHRTFDLSWEQFPRRTSFIPAHPGTPEYGQVLKRELFDDKTLPDRLDRFFNRVSQNGYTPRCGAGVALMAVRARYQFANPAA